MADEAKGGNMDRDVLIQIINGFATAGKVFSNEQDFQFEFALALKERDEVEEVKLEVLSFPRDLPNLNGDLRNLINNRGSLKVRRSQKEYTDIIVKTEGEYYAIELKFKGANQAYLYNSNSGDVAVMGHGAADINSYLFLKDIERLENINQRLFSREEIHIEEGFAILLTNNIKYRENGVGGIWQNFSISEVNDEEGVHSREIQGPLHLSFIDQNGEPQEQYMLKDVTYNSFSLNGDYTLEWENYPLSDEARRVNPNVNMAPAFSFLVVEVPQNGQQA